MKRILIVQPPIYDFNAFDLWMRPLGWLNLAAWFQSVGAEVRLIDLLDRFGDLAHDLHSRRHRMNRFGCGHYHAEDQPKPAVLSFVPRQYRRFGIPGSRFQALLESIEPPDLVLTGCTMTYWYPGVQEVIDVVHKQWPSVPVGVAGIYAILCPDHAQSNLNADFVYSGHDKAELVRLVGQRLGEVWQPVSNETFLPPDYSLLSQQKSLPLLTSSGCIYRCSYCASHRLQPFFHQFPIQELTKMMELCVDRYGTTDWAFYDDALLVNREAHLTPLLQKIIRRGWQCRFHTPNAIHCRGIDRGMAELMKASGFETIRLGLEFVQEDRQKQTGAKVLWKDYVAAMENLTAAGFRPDQLGTYVMIGYPGQSMEEMEESCRRVYEQGCPIRLTMFSPIPGTRDFESGLGHWRFDPRTDPLLQNCSLTPFRSDEFLLDVYEELKEKVNGWNRIVSSQDSPGAEPVQR